MNKFKSIAFLCHPYHRGGVTSWMVNAAYEAVRQGLQTYFITVYPSVPFISGGNRPAIRDMFTRSHPDLHLIAPVVDFTFELGEQEYRSLIYAETIRKYVPVNTPIIVSDDDAVWQAAALVANQYPMIGVLHSDDPHYYELASHYQDYVSRFVAVSKRIAFKTKINVPVEISVIPCGIELEQFYSPSDNRDRKDGFFTVCWVGRVEELQKRVSDIPLIAEELRKKGYHFKIEVAGTGPELEWLKKQIEIKELSDYISLLGWKSGNEIAELMQRSDILLQTSNYEGMSVAVMEALASGCVVVSSRVSGVEDYEFSDLATDCLYLYDIGNASEAGQKIIHLAGIGVEQRRKKAQYFAENVFSITACVSHYWKYIQNDEPLKTPLVIKQSLFSIKLKSKVLALARKAKYELKRRIK